VRADGSVFLRELALQKEFPMTQTSGEPSGLPLYNHTARKEWGVAILVRTDAGGNRGYLFADGVERTMANGYHQLMRRVEKPDVAQIAFYERQRGLLEQLAKGTSSTSSGPSFLVQLEKLRTTYPAGLADPKWLVNVRGEGAPERTPAHRDAVIRDAQEQLSLTALDELVKTQNYSRIWSTVVEVFSRSDLVPAAQFKKVKATNNEGMRNLALAVRELLHGKGPYEQRFGGYLAALVPLYGEAPHWEIATALSAAVHPNEHVCVHPTAFRQQLKTMSRGTVPTRATSAAYMRFSSIARIVSTKLTEQSERPRDLFDVYDFIRFTLSATPKARVAAKPKAKAKAPAR